MQIQIVVKEGDEGKRLDSYISTVKEELSRMTVKRLVEENKSNVNQKYVKPAYLVQQGDTIQIELEEPKETTLKAQDIPISVIYEDKDILVVNKPKGLVVHPANGNPDGTLVNAILALCKDSLSGIGGEIRPGIVHRLDKDTSGLMLVAKNDKTHDLLTDMLKKKEVKRYYIALVDGVIPNQSGTIDAPIGRDPKNRLKMAVTSKNSKEAITNFKVIKRFNSKVCQSHLVGVRIILKEV